MRLTNPRYLLISFSAIAVAMLGTVLCVHGFNEYGRELETFQQRLQTEARLVAEHAELSIAAADIVLSSIEADIARDGLQAFAGDPGRWNAVREALKQSPQLKSLMVADASGAVRLTTSTYPAPLYMTIADREYFIANRQGQHHYIGTPVVGRSSGRRLFPVSIRLSDRDGFAGVVVAALDIAYFQSFYTSEPAELSRSIAMYRRDGVLLSRYPAPVDPESSDFLGPVAEQLAASRKADFVGRSPLDAHKSIIAYRQIDQYPVVVSVGVDHGVFRSTLYPIWGRSLVAFLAFAVGTGLAIRLLDRAMQEAARAREAQLVLERKQRQSERLSLAVIRNIPNGWAAIVDQELRYVFIEGATADDPVSVPSGALGHTIYEVYPNETSTTLEGLAREALQGKASQRELAFGDNIYRFNVVPLDDEEQEVHYVLLLAQDITELKQVQLELEERNRQLQAFSFTDGLLGIANRRLFDQEFDREWRRAQRQQLPLALLMIDVDHFKCFNDTYGHMAGDECLRQVTAVLREAVSRPGDMVARYGGEEFAVLLPASDLAGALHLARQIRARLAERAIPFPDSPAGDVITVCIGAAAVQPQPEIPSLALIEEADAALYIAKKEGRNRIATSVRSA